ncbi:hypothetical protein [Actinomadura rugatobispora]|uniref:DUF4132 domain-containing protein n=1 Tax=Actinomadura rugatobispora TaxID=1994 RepID=A0ABW1AEZ6_9ACTN|nr:hypothetical protein GCM10010200_025040 [Actinomadura rugatobispora]
MRLRLAYGVVAEPGTAAWLPRPRTEPVRLAGEGDAPPGAAVALGPAGAGGAEAGAAVAELGVLVRDGGIAAAGAGVDLGGGFRSARLAGARGDQRDAVVAALRTLGVDGAGRLGERTGFLTGLFGPAVTRRVGAAAARAIGEGRWAALHLAAAASDVLGPEQLERVLALEAPGGADLIAGGRPSVLAADLRRVLEPVPGPRRLELLLDLWERVSEHHAWLARRERLLASQGRRDRLDDLRDRRGRYEDDILLSYLRAQLGAREPTLAEAARWQPEMHYWMGMLARLLNDARAATALLRTAVAVSDHGVPEGLARRAPLLRATVRALDREEYRFPLSRERKKRAAGLPARPGAYVREIVGKMDGPKPEVDGPAPYYRQRLARALNYGQLAAKMVESLLDDDHRVPEDYLRHWASRSLREWRENVGYSAVRGPADWTEAPRFAEYLLGTREPLAERLERGGDDAQEEVGDLVWCADLMDALANLHGHDAATMRRQDGPPWLDPDPGPEDPAPLAPAYDSVARAVSGAAQLVAFGGGRPPGKGVRTWEALVAGLLAEAEIDEALRGEFAVPAPLAALDGTVVPGTGGARFRLARSARTLAEWANYMGNCIAGPDYVEKATAGRCGLAALYGEDGHVRVNLELVPLRPELRGWHVSEMAARFNDDPDEDLARRVREWVGTIPGVDRAANGAATGEETPPTPLTPPGRSGSGRRAPRPRLLQDAGPALGELAVKAWDDRMTAEPSHALAVLASAEDPASEEAFAQLTRLRRLGPASLAAACRNVLDRRDLDLADLWTLSGIRPLEAALGGLDPALRERFGQLGLLTGAAPLPGSLRRLARDPRVAPAYSLGLVGLRLRAAIGRLVLDGDPAVTRSLTRRPAVPPLCALTVHVTCEAPAIELAPVAPPGAVTVPGFPASALDDEDGPWHAAFPGARELGADTGEFWNRVSRHGLRVPAAWVAGGGGWPALWSRAGRR